MYINSLVVKIVEEYLMDHKPEPRTDILESVKKNISRAEETRKQQRFEYNVLQFVQGNNQILKSDEFDKILVDYLHVQTEESLIFKRKVLAALGTATLLDDTELKGRALTILSLAGTRFLKNQDEKGILLLTESFLKWLEFEKDIQPELYGIIKQIEELTAWLLEKSFWVEGYTVLALFHGIQQGRYEKGPALRAHISQALDKLGSKPLFTRLTNGYLVGDERQHLFQNLLLFFEAQAVGYLLERLVQCGDSQERLALLHLIPRFGSLILPLVVKYLQNNPPWSVVRNVLCIIAELGDDTHYSSLKSCFLHEDKRVQYEMICYVVKLGGSERRDRLLDGLSRVHDDLKIFIIQLLAEHAAGDGVALNGLCGLLAEEKAVAPHFRNQLIAAVVAALKAFPCVKSIEILRNLHFDYTGVAGTELLSLQIDEALKFLKPQLRHHQQHFSGSPKNISFESDPQHEQQSLQILAKIEEKLRKLVGKGDMKGVGQLVHEHALVAAQNKNFFLAEKLRDRLLELNPMALNEAVLLGRAIEDEKVSAHSTHHLGVWRDLYAEMTTKAFNELYSVLRQEVYQKGDTIVRTGETDDVLYFLNDGYVSINCLCGANVNFLKRVGPGSILGGEQFFSASVWTVTLKALSSVHFQVLDHAKFLKVAEEFLEIEEELLQYCQKYSGVPDLLRMSGDDRREYPRYRLSLFTQNLLLDPYGNKGKRSFRGELLDISRNGLAFIIKISSRNNAKLLLGRQILTTLQQNTGEVLSECSGVVVGVRYHDMIAKDSTVHIKLSQKIEDAAFTKILALR